MTTEQRIIRAKVGLLELAKQLRSVSPPLNVPGPRLRRFLQLMLPGFRRAAASRCLVHHGCPGKALARSVHRGPS
jgi:hypothetical protein